MIDFGDDAVVYVDYEKHRLVKKVHKDNGNPRGLGIILFS